MESKELPVLRWGIVGKFDILSVIISRSNIPSPGCGLISSWFVADLVLPRLEAPTNHVIQALGSSSVSKGHSFAEKHCPSHHPSIYPYYDDVYNDPEVDIVYVGTPHVFHLQNALGAIKGGKHVLVEKPMTINARDAEILVSAAKEKGVFLMEGALNYFPATLSLLNVTIGKIIIVSSSSTLDTLQPPRGSSPKTAPPRTHPRSLAPSLHRLLPAHAFLLSPNNFPRRRPIPRRRRSP
jgi:predicted dehydrogenase